MLLLRFVLDLPAPSPLDAVTFPAATETPPDLLAFEAPAAFAEWSQYLERSPLLRARPWGSAFLDDPWPRRLLPDLHPAVEQALQERYTQQAAGAPHSLSWLSVRSGSRVRLEAHEAALVLDVAIPTPHAAEPDQRTGEVALPSDISALLGPLPLLQEADLIAALAPLAAPADTVATTPLLSARLALQRLGAFWYDDLRLLDVLRLYADHPLPSVRASVIAVASHVGYRLFLLERAACETDPLLCRVLGTLTAWTAPSPAVPPALTGGA